MGIKLVHTDGDSTVSLEQNEKGQFQVMLVAASELVRHQIYQSDQIVAAMRDYLQTIGYEISCYGRNFDQQQAIGALVKPV